VPRGVVRTLAAYARRTGDVRAADGRRTRGDALKWFWRSFKQFWSSFKQFWSSLEQSLGNSGAILETYGERRGDVGETYRRRVVPNGSISTATQ